VTGRKGSNGMPVIVTTFIRPNARHPSAVVGVARDDRRATRLQWVPGTTQPDRTNPPDRAQVPCSPDRA
jgi:hypothetical protein